MTLITTKAPVGAASFLNQAGIIGAALFAEEELSKAQSVNTAKPGEDATQGT